MPFQESNHDEEEGRKAVQRGGRGLADLSVPVIIVYLFALSLPSDVRPHVFFAFLVCVCSRFLIGGYVCSPSS